MYYQCEICDKIIRYETRDKHFEINYHKFFEQFTIMRYIVENPNINNLSEILKNYVDIHNEKYCFFDIICVVKVNDNQYIKHRAMTDIDFTF